MTAAVNTRRYDSSNRRRQAEETRLRILEAARKLFVRDGYTATTMTAIATEAGVAIQTVYASAKTKRDIFQAILDIAVSGHDEPVALISSAAWRDIEMETRVEKKMRLFARLHRQICEREAALIAVMADAGDPEIRALMQQNAQRRYKDQHQLASHLAALGALDAALTTDRATDIIWTLASEQSYLSLVRDRGWDPVDYEAWLAMQLNTSLLARSPSA